jgi:hypothetical protein
LLGLLDSASRQTQPPLNYLFSINFGLFARDDFKISPRLTLNLGLRWDVIGPQSDKFGRYAGFVPQLGKTIVADDRDAPNFKALVAGVRQTDLVRVARLRRAADARLHALHDLAPPVRICLAAFRRQRHCFARRLWDL